MDSLTQVALGAALGVATLGRRTAVWKAALWGGIAGTLPDLDAFVDHGDAISNMTLHRGHSHGLFWLTLAAPVLGWAASRVHGERALLRRWILAMWLAMFTHPLLDWMTVYGTQLLRPFSDHPFAVGSIFIIDPLYTVPLLVGLLMALARPAAGGLRWNAVALGLSTAYLAWSAIAQAHVHARVMASEAARGVPAERVLVTPTPFNTLLWRVVVMHADGYDEGFRSLLDGDRPVRFERFPTDTLLRERLLRLPSVQRMAWFSHGFYTVAEEGRQGQVIDLRMGQEPNYVFRFRVAQRTAAGAWHPVAPTNMGLRGDIGRQLRWLGPRMLGADLPPPR